MPQPSMFSLPDCIQHASVSLHYFVALVTVFPTDLRCIFFSKLKLRKLRTVFCLLLSEPSLCRMSHSRQNIWQFFFVDLDLNYWRSNLLFSIMINKKCFLHYSYPLRMSFSLIPISTTHYPNINSSIRCPSIYLQMTKGD